MTSDAAMKTELAELRRMLWLLIATVKQVVHALPPAERQKLLDQAMEAERKLS